MIPVLGFCGASGSGKTTLLCKVVAELTARGLSVGVIKHHGHVPSDWPPSSAPWGEPKDSDRLLAAGAQRAALAEATGLTLWTRPAEAADPADMAARLMGGLDLVLLEGFKSAELDKIEVVAPGMEPWLPTGGRLLALARRGGSGVEAGLPVLDADRPARVAEFVLAWLAAQPKARLLVEGRPVAINPFVQTLLQNTLRALVAGLKDSGEGQVISDDNISMKDKLTSLARKFHRQGTFWNDIDNIVETPLFVDSMLTSMVQVADLVAYAIRVYLEKGNSRFFTPVFARVDHARRQMVGGRHYTWDSPCNCLICQAAGR